MINLRYLKSLFLVTIVILTFQDFYAAAQDESPFLSLLYSVPQEAVYPEMNANVIQYVNYDALAEVSGIPPIANRAAYNQLDQDTQIEWQLSLLRLRTGPSGFVNLAEDRIASMPELLGFDYFDVDQAMVYGSAPFVGNLIRSTKGNFLSTRTASALRERGYDLSVVATGTAWGKGGDGQTDMNDLEMGDPFGGDVGLSSRVAILNPYTIVNSFLWGIVFEAAETNAGQSPSYAERDEYRLAAEVLDGDDAHLIQAIVMSAQAGANLQPNPDVDQLPPYTLAAIADLQQGDKQVQRLMLIYDNEPDALVASEMLPDLIAAFDAGGWMSFVGVEKMVLEVHTFDDDPLVAVTYDLVAPAATPQQILEGATEPALLFGFWSTAIQQKTFFLFAIDLAD